MRYALIVMFAAFFTWFFCGSPMRHFQRFYYKQSSGWQLIMDMFVFSLGYMFCGFAFGWH